MSTLFVDTINEKTTGNGVKIPGHVVQVKTGTNASSASTTSTSDTATGLKVTIAPTSATSKIYISTTMGIQNGSAGGGTRIKLFRKKGSGTAEQILIHGGSGLLQYSANGNNISLGGYVFLDSPNTTDACEYEIYYSKYYTGTSYFFADGQIVVMEVAQ